MAEIKITDLCKRAIKELQAIIDDPDTDDATRTEATKQVKRYRMKSQEAALDALVARGPALAGLMSDLQGVIKKAEGGGSSDAVAKLRGFVGEVQGYIDLGKGLG